MENLGKVTLLLVVIVAAFLTTLLGAHVVLSISNLYNISFITNFTFVQVFGVISLIHIIAYKYKKSDKDKTFTDVAKQGASEIATKTLFLLLSWGLAFLSYAIIA